MNYTGPKVRRSRQVGLALTPKAVKYLERRPYPPGEHGRRRPKQPSEYKRQLTEKQRLRYQYNLSERQLANAFHRASRTRGTTGEELLVDLERRLDATVLHGGLARTIYAARQYVTHGHILVDGRKVDRPGYRMRPGQVVSVKPRSQRLLCFRDALETTAATPPYLQVDRDELRVTLRRLPVRAEIPVICAETMVVEFYSR